MTSSSVKIRVIHPLLFAAFPILFLYAQNAREMLLKEAILPLLAVLCFAAISTPLLGKFLQSRYKGGLVTTIIIVLFFSYGHLRVAMPEIGFTLGQLRIGPNKILMPVWLIVLFLGIRLTVRTRRDLGALTRILNVLGLVLVAVQIIQGAAVAAIRPERQLPTSRIFTPGQLPERLPDVYFLIVDGYGREDILRNLYGYDNSGFLGFLRGRGFFIADSSHTNYCQTLLSTAATMNMDYISQLGEYDPASKDRIPLIERLWDNDVCRLFKELGYSIAAFASGYGSTELKSADKYISATWTASEFQNILYSTTPLPIILRYIYSPFDVHRKRITHVLDNLPEDLGIPLPKFVFAHIVSPHPPFVFGPHGEPIQRDRVFNLGDGSHYYETGGTVEEYRAGYSGQMTYINSRLKAVIAELLDRPPDQQPIIILQSDHGPGSELSWVGSATTNLKERFSILNAWYLPGIDENPMYHRISSVNTFRVIFNLYFGTQFDLLPDLSFYSTWTHPFALTPVTRKPGGELYDNLLEYYLSRSPDRVAYRHVTHPQEPGTPCDAKGCILITDDGLCVELDKVYYSTFLEISLDQNDNYVLHFRSDSTVLATQTIYADLSRAPGLRLDMIRVPIEAVDHGYNNIFILPRGGDGLYGMGHLRLGDPRQR
ncbi:MAG: hypothetical protein JSV44_11635 [Candidatus Zixiibacteriota bacterium]|nr:MAG: hypothetical protein JSV44_11635 [candidate division Zixibacteria bacterium]